MRNIGKSLLVIFLTVLAASCTENIELRNDRIIQAVKNGELFKQNARATIGEDGSIVFVANSQAERLEIFLESSAPGTYELSGTSNNVAIYTDKFNDKVFTTNNFFALGEVVIEEGGENQDYNGVFDFIAYNSTNTDSLYMREGLIFQVPARLGMPNDTPEQGSINATIDGNGFTSSSVATQITSGRIQATGNSGGTTITLIMPEDVTTGSYPLDVNPPITAIYSDGSGSAASESGTLNVTTVDTANSRVAGTFEFIVENDGPEVTNGEFEIFY